MKQALCSDLFDPRWRMRLRKLAPSIEPATHGAAHPCSLSCQQRRRSCQQRRRTLSVPGAGVDVAGVSPAPTTDDTRLSSHGLPGPTMFGEHPPARQRQRSPVQPKPIDAHRIRTARTRRHNPPRRNAASVPHGAMRPAHSRWQARLQPSADRRRWRARSRPPAQAGVL